MTRNRTLLLLLIGLLLLFTLACQTGEVLTPAEATARAREARSVKISNPLLEGGNGGEKAPTDKGPQPGDTVELIGKGYMINLYQEAGSNRINAQQERGTKVTIKDSLVLDGDIWYLIDAPTGLGWVKADNVQEIPAASTGPQVGDKLYLKGKGYMVSLYQEAGSNHIIAQQERGAQVILKDIVDVDGETWYLIDAPTGLGWVPADNTTTEKP